MCLLLTLLVTPVAYALFDSLETRVARWFATLRQVMARFQFRRPDTIPTSPSVQEEIAGD
jgi:hypothetical protein